MNYYLLNFLPDGFASDPFKGSDPFATDVLFAEVNVAAGDVDDEVDSLSCAENKASTGTQCFESEFPDEGSDIELSYSREDLAAIAVAGDCCGFKPIQSSSEEMGTEPIKGWRSQGQYSVESDPNGYELDLGTISPPPDIEEHSLGSVAGEDNPEAVRPEPGNLFSSHISKCFYTIVRLQYQFVDTFCSSGFVFFYSTWTFITETKIIAPNNEVMRLCFLCLCVSLMLF